MKLENSFTVPVPRADAWKVLMDVERIAPCMPGATLTSREGDSFTGTVKVKVGPINLTYGGQAKFVSLDEENGVAVIEGSGKETRGTGTAKALITCRLVETGGSTKVDVETDLAVTGKPASFGRGVLADVSAKLVDRFAACLSDEIESGDGPAADAAAADATAADPTLAPIGNGPAVSVGEGGAPVPTPGATPTPSATPTSTSGATSTPGETSTSTSPPTASSAPAAPRVPREAEPIDLMETAGLPVLKAAAPVGGALLLVLLAYLVGWRRGAKAFAAAVED